MNSVVVVESPAKAKTIEGYLGDSYSVIASFGHVRDMADKDGAVIPGAWSDIKWSLNKRGKEQVKEILDKDIEAIICSNTTISHNYPQIGGLSGEELFEISNKTLISFRKFLGTTFPIIASGGVMSREHFEKKLELGADLVQIYTGMIYKGPALVTDILNS